MQEPAPVALGIPLPWTPLRDTCIPERLRVPAFSQWVSSYFAHSDLSSRDPDILSEHVPATFRMPTIFNMTKEEVSRVVTSGIETTIDKAFIANFRTNMGVNYHKACFDAETRKLFGSMKIALVAGDVSVQLGPAMFWAVEDEDTAHGSGWVDCHLVHGFNHVVSTGFLWVLNSTLFYSGLMSWHGLIGMSRRRRCRSILISDGLAS